MFDELARRSNALAPLGSTISARWPRADDLVHGVCTNSTRTPSTDAGSMKPIG